MDPISNVLFVCDARLVPPNSNAFVKTVENSDADLWPNSFFGKSKKRYLVIERQKNAEQIITDMCLIGESESVPTGYFAINQTTDTGEEPIKDLRLCIQE